MKIAVLTMEFPPSIGGVQKYLFEITSRLCQYHQIVVVTPEAIPLSNSNQLQWVKPAPANAFGYYKALLQLKPDQMLVGHSHPQLLLPAYMYANKQYATIAYGNDFLAGQKKWHRLLFNQLLRYSNPLITITYANALRLRHLDIPNAQVVHPGTDPLQFDAAPRSTGEKSGITLISVGRLVSRKGIDQTLKALARIVPLNPNVIYNIVGDGPDRSRLQQLVHRLDLDSIVNFLGQVSDVELHQLYQQADIFVMPSREESQSASIEGFGIVYLEANASGIPVVAGRSGGAVEAVKDGETGVLVDPYDLRALVDALLLLIENPVQRQKMGVWGRKWVETEMNWDRAAEEFRYILENVGKE